MANEKGSRREVEQRMGKRRKEEREREELDKCKEERLKRKTHDKGAASRSTSGAASKKKVSPNNWTICIISEEILYSPHNIRRNSVCNVLNQMFHDENRTYIRIPSV